MTLVPTDEPSPPNHEQRNRAEAFGAVAERYDRARPDYPAEMIDDLLANGATHVLDIGCGTGKLGSKFVARGCTVTGVEQDPRMATVARQHGIDVEVARFEDWDPDGRTWDLAVCGQAWHWIDPQRGPQKAYEALSRGGALALCWNHDHQVRRRDGEPGGPGSVDQAISDAYERAAPDMAGSAFTNPSFAADFDSLVDSGLFEVELRESYRRTMTWTTDQWVDAAGTHSNFLILPVETQAQLIEELRSAVDSVGGVVTREVETVLIVGVAR